MRQGHPLRRQVAFRRSALVSLIGALSFLGTASPVLAFEIDTGNNDLAMRFDTTVRYNTGMRLKDRNPVIANNASFDEGDFLFDRHDTIANRLDLLGEFDIRWKKQLGARVSAAAWVDGAYGDKSARNPAIAGTSYVNQDFTSYTKRFYKGPSGEFLDTFVFADVPLADGRNANIKLGRHAVVWGEGLFGSTNTVAYAQAPSDLRKLAGNPGASAKETALPINQLSGSMQLSEELTLLGQYTLEWRPNRLPEGGTYFGPADLILEGPNVGRGPAQNGDKGDVGLAVKWSPAWMDASVGAYYRKFDDKGAWVAQLNTTPPVFGVGFDTRAVYVKDVEILGFSLAKNIGGLSVAAELSHRKNGALTSLATASAGPAGRWEGALGDTWHGVLNAVASYGVTSMFDSASLVAELGWSQLDKVTKNPTLFRASGYNATCNADAKMKGCADKNFYSLGFSFTPTWLQVFPGTDVSVPFFVSYGLKGNAANNSGGNIGSLSYKLGVSFAIHNRHLIDLAYNGYRSRIDAANRVLGAPYNDKAWLGLTYQITF